MKDKSLIVTTWQSAAPYDLLMTRDPWDEVFRLSGQVLPNKVYATSAQINISF